MGKISYEAKISSKQLDTFFKAETVAPETVETKEI